MVILESTELEGVRLVRSEPSIDERGSFITTYDRLAFAEAGLETEWHGQALSRNLRQGTIRGLHYQLAPWAEAKVIRCTRGRVFDVIVDTRTASSQFGRWMSCELGDDDGLSLYAAPGMAHGFQTLCDDAEILYLLSAPFVPSHATGIAWDSPSLAIPWPEPVSVMSERDAALPRF